MYTIEELRERIAPVARAYGLRQVYLFGSYARGEADENSDVDLLVDTPEPYGLFRMEELRQKLEEAVQIKVDVLSVQGVQEKVKGDNKYLNKVREEFQQSVERDKVKLYEDYQ